MCRGSREVTVGLGAGGWVCRHPWVASLFLRGHPCSPRGVSPPWCENCY